MRFSLPLSAARFVEYYLEVADRATGTTATFPADGANNPLRVYVVPPAQPRHLPALDTFREPDSVIHIPWGASLGEAGLVVGNEGSTVGPQAIDVAASGDVYLLDENNKRVEVFDKDGLLVDSISLDVGPLGDMVLGDDGTLYVLDTVPSGPGSEPIIRHVTPGGVPFAPPQEVTSTPAPEWGTTLLREVNGGLWAYGVPSDAWHPAMGVGQTLPAVQMGMPSGVGELLRRVLDRRQIDIVPVASPGQSGITLTAPGGWYFGELDLVEPDGAGGFWVVVRTWQENPQPQQHHDVIHLSSGGDMLDHFAVANSEYAETGSLSEFRLGDDGRLYQIWTDPDGLQVRGFDLTTEE